MTDGDQALLVEGLRFALAAHGAQTRKGTEIPYVSHLLQVAGLVLEHGGDTEQAVAALLHDVIEDCPGVNAGAVESRFGPEVARMVQYCSDLLDEDAPGEKSRWLDRKRHYLARLRGADAGTRLIAACDKLHNLRALVSDLEQDGIETLDRFTATHAQTRWYYEEVRDVLGQDLPARLGSELDDQIERLRHFVPVASPENR